ncbi:MAG: hypothetical protein J6R30_08485 [Bacteroidales bacterium]|nr:hypothetical protein [Bacteroidales bacterium]
MFEKPKTIAVQLDEYTALEKDQYFSIKDSENSYIINGVNVCNYMTEMYGNYKTRSEIKSLWTLYTATHYTDFIRAYEAFMSEYEPLDNYNGVEQNVYLNQDGVKTDRTTHGKTTTTTANDVTTENQTTSFDSTTYRPDSKSTQSGNTTSADTGTTTNTTEHTPTSLTVGETTYTADNITAETKHRHGNLGVTSTQQMITQELELRKNPVALLYIDEFINDYAYYVSETWGCNEWL